MGVVLGNEALSVIHSFPVTVESPVVSKTWCPFSRGGLACKTRLSMDQKRRQLQMHDIMDGVTVRCSVATNATAATRSERLTPSDVADALPGAAKTDLRASIPKLQNQSTVCGYPTAPGKHPKSGGQPEHLLMKSSIGRVQVQLPARTAFLDGRVLLSRG